MAQRHLGAAAHAELAMAWRRLVHAGGKGLALAAHLEVPASRVTEYGTPDSGRSPSIATVLEAEAFMGRPFVTEALAAAQGLRLVPAEAAEAPDAVEKRAAGLMATMGEAFAAYGAAMADRQLSRAERKRLEARFSEVSAAALKLAASLRGVA